MVIDITKIVVSDEHFLYLPLYYARYKNYFELLPKDCGIEIIRSTQRTDKSAFAMLMDENTADFRKIDIAVCDPSSVMLYAEPKAHPVVLAGLITNSAFWAVNHKSNRVTFFDHLATFDRIISFKKGSTSYGIASRIFCDPAKAEFIQTVNPNEELNLLVDSGPGTLALSPNILRIQELIESRSETFGIELALAETNEYRDMLVTALLTRRDVLERKPLLIKGLLEAIQTALVKVRNEDYEVVAYACDRFGVQEHTVQKALAEARRVDVYPPNIKVSQPTWIKLSELSFYSNAKPFDDAARLNALNVYRIAVEQYSGWASDAVRAVESRGVNPPPPPPPQNLLNSLWPLLRDAIPPLLTFAMLCGIYVWKSPSPLPWYVYCGLLIGVVIAMGVARRARITPMSISGVIYWLPLVGCALCVLAISDISAAREIAHTWLGMNLKDDSSTKFWLIGVVGAAIYGEFKYIEKKLLHRTSGR